MPMSMHARSAVAISVAAIAVALALACASCAGRDGDEFPAAASADGRAVATFRGFVDVARGRIVIEPVTPSSNGFTLEQALATDPDVQDGVAGSGPANTVELVTAAGAGVVAGGCGAFDTFEGDVTLRSFFARALIGATLQITAISPASGHQVCNGAPAPLGVDNNLFGSIDYGTLAASGGSATQHWKLQIPDGQNFTFSGTVFDQAPTISVASAGSGNTTNDFPSVSTNGTRVAFRSTASFGATDTNGATDVFVRDSSAGTTTLVSATSGSATTTGNGVSAATPPIVCPGGRFVVFDSTATNLTAAATTLQQIFRRDLQTNTTVLVSQNGAGAQGNGASSVPSCSSDGNLVVFQSAATNLAGADANGAQTDIYLRNISAGTTVLVSRAEGVAQPTLTASGASPSISSDGTMVAFLSVSVLNANDNNAQRDAYRRDLAGAHTALVDVKNGSANPSANGTNLSTPRLSANGSIVAFQSQGGDLVAGDGNAQVDCFVRDFGAGTTSRMSLSGAGAESNTFGAGAGGGTGVNAVSVSDDGRFVAFMWNGDRIVGAVTTGLSVLDADTSFDTFVHDRQTGQTAMYSAPPSGGPKGAFQHLTAALSGDGRTVAFQSTSNLLVTGTQGTQVFVVNVR